MKRKIILFAFLLFFTSIFFDSCITIVNTKKNPRKKKPRKVIIIKKPRK